MHTHRAIVRIVRRLGASIRAHLSSETARGGRGALDRMRFVVSDMSDGLGRGQTCEMHVISIGGLYNNTLTKKNTNEH